MSLDRDVVANTSDVVDSKVVEVHVGSLLDLNRISSGESKYLSADDVIGRLNELDSAAEKHWMDEDPSVNALKKISSNEWKEERLLLREFIKGLTPNELRALSIGMEACAKSIRKTGEPTVYHLIRTAKYLVGLYDLLGNDLKSKTDKEVDVCVAFVHDTYEDEMEHKNETNKSVTGGDWLSYLEKYFSNDLGKQIKEKTYAVSKFKIRGEVMDLMTYREVLLFAIKKGDVGVLLNRIADRQDNIRTMSGHKLTKQAELIQETEEFYIPIAKTLGLDSIVKEFEEIAQLSKKRIFEKDLENKIAFEKGFLKKYEPTWVREPRFARDINLLLQIFKSEVLRGRI